jgi:hypothetical protein
LHSTAVRTTPSESAQAINLFYAGDSLELINAFGSPSSRVFRKLRGIPNPRTRQYDCIYIQTDVQIRMRFRSATSERTFLLL